jgi:hypothetical protein
MLERGGEDKPSADRRDPRQPSEPRSKSRPITESRQALPIMPFEPTTPFETVMVCERLDRLWISEVHREEIDWSILEAASSEISRLEKMLAFFFTGAY